MYHPKPLISLKSCSGYHYDKREHKSITSSVVNTLTVSKILKEAAWLASLKAEDSNSAVPRPAVKKSHLFSRADMALG